MKKTKTVTTADKRKAFGTVKSYRAIVQRCVALLPWRSNLTLLDKLSDPDIRLCIEAELAGGKP